MKKNVFGKTSFHHFLKNLYFLIVVYINIGEKSSDSATLAFSFTGTSTSRNWEIKVTQIECSNPNRFSKNIN